MRSVGRLGLAAALALLGLRPAAAQPASFRLDLSTVSVVVIYHPEASAFDGYRATYRFEVPQEQTVSLTSASPQAEFDAVEVEADREAIVEVRTFKAGEPFTLVIRQGTAGPRAFWDAPASERMPPLPSPPEVARRFALGASLFRRVQDRLGLSGFAGGDGGVVTISLTGVENLFLESRNASARYAYKMYALGTETMVEELLAEIPGGPVWTVEISASLVLVTRQVETGTMREAVELRIHGGQWEAVRRAGAGDSATERAVGREEAAELLRLGLEQLQQARRHFGIGFGRDLSAIRLP